jgi:hypothetical protein
MRTNPIRPIAIYVVLMLLIAGCYLPGAEMISAPTQAPVNANAIYTAAAQTLVAQLTINAPPLLAATSTAPGTPVLVPESTNLPTFTPIIFTSTATATATPPYTSTPEYPVITANIDTNCRSGPGPEYKVLGYLLVGQTSRVFGRNSSGTWWNIENPSKPGSTCWVWGGSTTISGSTVFIPVFTPPPVPPTETSGAAAFTAAYVGDHNCSGDSYAIFSVKNVSGVTFESMNIKTKKVSNDAIISNVATDKPFMDSSSECPPGEDQLGPGDKAYVASLIEGAPSGKEAKTIIYLCTKEGEDGTCVSVAVTYDFP